MNHRPASFDISTPSAPPHLDTVSPRRTTGHVAPPLRPDKPANIDQALQAMLETCPVSDRLTAFAAALADEGRTEL